MHRLRRTAPVRLTDGSGWFRRWSVFGAIAEPFPEPTIVPDRSLFDGDTVIVLGHMSAVAAERSRTLDSLALDVYELAEDLVVRWASHFDSV